ncbi:MAG TPA: PsaJ protein [Nostocaceae cyanobacterium]|nr:PsaJ protein [Nostocaceae cyanobacterium]
MKKSSDQRGYFLQYLSLAPVLAVITISIAFTTWVLFNFFFPDLLFHPMP